MILDSAVLFRGRVFDVRQDQIQLPDGREMSIDLIVHRGAVTILPIDEDQQAWFVRQYRHPAHQELLELPAGVIDDGEKPMEAALRELREEIGMTAERLVLLGEFFLAPGYSTEYMYVFLASGLNYAPLQPDDDEMIKIEKIAVNQINDLVLASQIQDAKSLAALFLWQLKNQKRSP